MKTEQKKNILFLTATRADFGKLKPLIREVEQSDAFEARIFATGMHMLARYGSTFKEIYKEGFKNIFSFINQDATVNTQMDLVLSNTIHGIGHYVREFPPDLIVVHGDRIETLAGAIVGALNNILVAHVEGGEISGTVDELIRHAVSKLAHIHFVANDEARRRLIQMGEEKDAVFIIGSPDIDIMLSNTLPTIDEVKRRYEIPFLEYILFIYHPVTTELPVLKNNIIEVVTALEESDLNFVVIYPNNDIGSDIIMDALQRCHANHRFRFIPSMRFEYFLTLLKHTKAIVGNSSAGIREAPVYGVPTINIGTRQTNRFDYSSIINVPEERRMILEKLKNIPNRLPSSSYFGNGGSARRFLEVLQSTMVWNRSNQKHFEDISFKK